MEYEVGMYGGSFEPLHIGHLNNIIRAASICKELYIIISWSKKRDTIPKELKYRWIYNNVKHLDNVKILLIEDNAKSKEEYNEAYWKKGASEIKKAISKKIDVVFCGSDYLGTNRFESLYQSKIIYFDRKEVPISSTEIRKNVYKYWHYLPPICRPYYAKKILIVGGESTGKSTLVHNLALSYNTNFVREIGRDTCETAGGEEFMNKYDLYENLLRQKTEEIKALKDCNRLLFIDTDALTTEFYSNFLLENKNDIEKCNDLADSITRINEFDLVFFLEPTVEFIQDGTRSEEIKANRIKYSNQIKELFYKHKIDFISLDGNYLDRFNKIKEVIKDKFDIETI